MIRKDFEILADALREAKPAEPADPKHMQQWQITADTIMRHIARTHPAFNKWRFIERLNREV